MALALCESKSELAVKVRLEDKEAGNNGMPKG